MNITFCINTARNERHHIELLFKSLNKNLSRKDYPIIVYVENDNQGTTDFLITQKQIFPNLKIVINPLPIPLGYARNINLMFEMANTDIVSYLQSDMVICPSYDIEIIKHLDENTIISSTRIEPPLHPPSSEKITHDFGLDPTKFRLEEFSAFANLNKSEKITSFWFAPFTLYKKNWLDIGGHDTLFRRSREDSDILYRFTMAGTKIKQVWNALVYHFTCVSSRGIEWWTEKAKQRTQLQGQADSIELSRFLRKWSKFKHDTTFNPDTEYKYNISANIKGITSVNEIINNHYKFNKIYIENEHLRNDVITCYDEFHVPANQLLNISSQDWNLYNKYYRTWTADDIFTQSPVVDDVILDINITPNSLFNPYYDTLNDLIHSIRNEPPATYEIEDINAVLTINNPVNHIKDQIIVKNPSLIDIKFTIL